MKLVISIDVEEEGLFSGRYLRTPTGVANVAALERLVFIPRDFGFPLTLLATYQVARDPAACRVLARWRDHYGAEIGAHLHHWNTPPFADLPDPEPVASEKLPRALLRDKLASLFAQLGAGLAVAPRSFRMGRFDAGPRVFNLLPEFGLEVDSSVAPLTDKNPDPRFFLAPADPFVLGGLGPEDQTLLEVPITLVPVIAGTPELIDRLAARASAAWGARLRSLFRYGGVTGVQPAMFPLASLKLAAYLHRRRRGRVLTLYFHSSELQPGASPLVPTEAAASRFVDKIRAFLTWLVKTGPVEGTTLAALGEDWRQAHRPDQAGATGGEGMGPARSAPGSAF